MAGLLKRKIGERGKGRIRFLGGGAPSEAGSRRGGRSFAKASVVMPGGLSKARKGEGAEGNAGALADAGFGWIPVQGLGPPGFLTS